MDAQAQLKRRGRNLQKLKYGVKYLKLLQNPMFIPFNAIAMGLYVTAIIAGIFAWDEWYFFSIFPEDYAMGTCVFSFVMSWVWMFYFAGLVADRTGWWAGIPTMPLGVVFLPVVFVLSIYYLKCLAQEIDERADELREELPSNG